MTFWTTVGAVLYALCVWRLIDLTIDYGFSIYRRKKFDRILNELDDLWAKQTAARKPVRKKAVAKKK